LSNPITLGGLVMAGCVGGCTAGMGYCVNDLLGM
jgi:hypothetical protein